MLLNGSRFAIWKFTHSYYEINFQTKIRMIQDEIDRTDVKIETVLTSGSGRKRKGKDDANKEKVEELKKHKERLNYHVTNLEVCMRLVTNDQKEAKEVMDVLQEAVESYVEALDPDSDMNPKELDPFGNDLFFRILIKI